MPESRHKYLFERLGDQDFQQLVSALLADQFPGFVPMALRQADGGRDGLRRDEAGRLLIYQVKWSVNGKEKDPVPWLEQVVRDEEDNLRRLAAQGVRRYALVTNVPSTAKLEVGTFDQLNKRLEAHAKAFGFDEMTCFWREALNGWVDNAPTATKWSYAEMLAGWDLVRYLIAEHADTASDGGTRQLVRRVAAAQWEEDRQVKFNQSDVDRQQVVDLFVDVTADRVHTPTTRTGRALPPASLGGAADYLARSTTPFTLVRGAPGQGKSTLTQYLCQVYRSPFLPEAQRPATLPSLDEPRFPVRLDLSDYARWMSGVDVWSDADDRTRGRTKTRRGAHATLECFLADLMTHEGGGAAVTTDDVQRIFDRVPSLVVLDGLDEVGSPSVRGRVVAEIDKFAARAVTYPVPPKVVVTTRPSAGELPEPAAERFEIITLNRLSTQQRDAYLRKWCAVRGIHGKDGRTLRNGFKDKSQEPYIDELAGNPMQLTILLDLIHQQGFATPTQRTDLYDKYVDLLLARESNKHPRAVRDHRDELLEIIPFLGWYLHARTEQSPIDSSMSVAALKAAIRHFQTTYGNPESVVDELFEGATDRLWALTSKVDGTFEFEVLSLREYFAARFLYRNAGEDQPGFDSTTVLRELLRRPYWLNTARFYGGNAKDRDIFAVTASIEEELSSGAPPASFLAAWALLTDGVFQRRPREARKVLAALCSDVGLAVLLSALDRRDIVALPELPHLADGDTDPTWTRLTALIAQDPAHPANELRTRGLRELLNQRGPFAAWWYTNLAGAVGTSRQHDWLALGARCEVAAGRTADLEGLDLSNGAAEAFLSTGLVAPPGSPLEKDLLAAVLDGQCANVASVRSMPAQVAAALAPRNFFAASEAGFATSGDSDRLRSDAVGQLGKVRSPYAAIAKHRVFKAGHKGNTFPWEITAAALHAHVGRCWLASEIAIIGAASPMLLAHTKRPGATAFGPSGHPSELIAQTRAHADDAAWWRSQLEVVKCDDLGRAEWSFALWSVASGPVVSELLPTLNGALEELSQQRRRAVLRAAEAVTDSGWLSARPVTADGGEGEFATLISRRNAQAPAASRSAPASSEGAKGNPGPLLSVARGCGWFKVDAQPAYR